MRLFFAVWPPAKTARVLADWAREVARDTGGKATAESQIHLTLAFLGEADPNKAFNAANRVRGSPHALPIDDTHYWSHNKIVWVGPKSMPPALGDLASQLQRALAGQSFVLEKRPFAAHITLLRKARAPQSLPPLPAVEWPVSEFLLMQSSVSSKGSAYKPLERFPLYL